VKLVEDAFERDDGEHNAAVVEPIDLGVRACVGHRMLCECPIGMQTGTLRIETFRPLALAYAMAALRLASSSGMRTAPGVTRRAAARRLHGHDDDAFISPTTSIPGRCICS
jgi:hypothetical protein